MKPPDPLELPDIPEAPAPKPRRKRAQAAAGADILPVESVGRPAGDPTGDAPEAAVPVIRKKSSAKTAKKTPGSKKPRKGKKRRGKKGKGRLPTGPELLRLLMEWGALLALGVLALMVALGYAGQHLSGGSFLRHRLPFALAALLTTVTAALALLGWWRLRATLVKRHMALPAITALLLLAVALIPLRQGRFAGPLAQFRLVVGGKAEMRDATLRHQVFAGYRRLNAADMAAMFDRAGAYAADIEEAARAFRIDPDILNGLAAAESSFLPRPSADGGQGLFQLTRIPQEAEKEALARLKTDMLDPANHRHNAFAAAGTLKIYLERMNGNMILGLLAYNIGPQNGGLRDIMGRYGATDFITIQPYLQELPRNYPVRVLTYALAFRVRRTEGRLLPYEEGENARRVQRIGIPGL